MSKNRLARQLRGHVELLAGGGIRHLKLSKEARAMGKKTAAPARKQKASRTASEGPRVKAATKELKPVIVPSAALAELKQFKQVKKARQLEELAEQVRTCGDCKLCETRTQTVFGTGHPDSPLLIVGEAPGGDEDIKGIPFVGRAGKLLTDIIEKGMKYRREHVYIANVLKCRPPHNRNPEPEEIEACRGYLLKQIEILNPKVILAVGRFPAQWLTGLNIAIGKIRGRVHEFNGRKVVATYHPAYLLRNYTVETRKKVHEDVLRVVEILGKGPLV